MKESDRFCRAVVAFQWCHLTHLSTSWPLLCSVYDYVHSSGSHEGNNPLQCVGLLICGRINEVLCCNVEFQNKSHDSVNYICCEHMFGCSKCSWTVFIVHYLGLIFVSPGLSFIHKSLENKKHGGRAVGIFGRLGWWTVCFVLASQIHLWNKHKLSN